MLKATLLAVAALTLTAPPVLAAPCKDAKGKFIKCPQKPAMPKKCKDVRGKSAKCGTPGAKPI